ncbi:hypothetical protein LINPERPRIM_LOCUS14580 [Linum perenne]
MKRGKECEKCMIQQVTLRSGGKRSPEYSTRSPFLAAMGSTCKQGKPNGNQKTGGYRIGQKMIQKAKAHPLEERETSSRPKARSRPIHNRGAYPT